jgi:hypothetical protein
VIICDFCLLRSQEGACRIGLNIPKTMKCREFAPGIERFCAKPADFVSLNQITDMARFFGLEKTELKKVKTLMRISQLSPAVSTLPNKRKISEPTH